jgi:hypothetical protein
METSKQMHTEKDKRQKRHLVSDSSKISEITIAQAILRREKGGYTYINTDYS